METTQVGKCTQVCEPGECDFFEFMSKKLGIRVLHPGGLGATEFLAERCGISKDMTILDAGCGSGSSSIFLARRYGCKVVGVDIDNTLLMKAQARARRKGILGRVSFRLADIQDLPFQDEAFDGAIFQAALIFTEKSKALQEIHRQVSSEGFFGAVELAWKCPPPQDVVVRVRDVLCAAAINAEHHLDWMNLFNQNGFDVFIAELRDLEFSFRGMLKNEGLLSTLRIAFRCSIDESAKRKTKAVGNLFREIQNYLGYGVYVGRKRKIDRSIARHQDPRALGYPGIREI
ncbi:MAG: class I SAM-dependent methyltransferase [Candidatus Hodarchaeota archaeon]